MSSETIQWYPGHMRKADRNIREQLKLIDTVIEVVDARVPLASRNPDILDYTERKNHILLLNKCDLADEEELSRWEEYFKSKDITAIPYNALDNRESGKLVKAIKGLSKNPENRCLVVGIPNVGKSAVINSLVGKRKTQTGNKPGVTKGQQWLKADKLMLLDTPGILWPKFEDQRAAEYLTWIAAISDKRYEVENVAGELMKFLIEIYPEKLESHYGIEIVSDEPPWMVFDKIAENRGLLLKGGEYDYRRTSELILNDFRNGKLGRISIERRS